ncbi:lectin C-type domain protein, partial [Ancylostoma duodenale]
MRLLILATFVAVIGAGQIKVEDDSSDSSVGVHISEREVPQFGHIEPSTEPPTTKKKRHKHIYIYIPKKAKVPPHMYKVMFDGWLSLWKHKYKLFWHAKNFNDAEKRCKQNGAHLVSIHNQLENVFVHDGRVPLNAIHLCGTASHFNPTAPLCNNDPPQCNTVVGLELLDLTSRHRNIESFEDFVYIGLRMDQKTGKWSWTDGSKVDYTEWAKHQPDQPKTEHCAQ